ncbi:hypothetical protein [Polaribacter sp. L3A8]|uniref:hypothetical protein n=1 Tax=Polaribacter sp. L3A8 TaxID=2686361 RepID=UPI00131DB22C|nr:hypothetical protein [Polaribacter sp. L3A8]
MKTKQKMINLTKQILLVLFFGIIASSCSNEDEMLLNNDSSEAGIESINDKEPTVYARVSCNETSFPTLGPSASSAQTCNDATSPKNIGTLDCRTNSGGYSNFGNYGKYQITGSSTRYGGTKTRVERHFSDINRANNRNGKLSYRFVIDDLSDEQTCIVQAHAVGTIVAGQRVGQSAESAVILLYATKTSDPNKFNLYTHESTTPYTTTNSGARTVTFFRQVTKGLEYDLTFKTGYNSAGNAYTAIRVWRGESSKYKNLNHTYSTTGVYVRYGAYGANDTGDRTATVRMKNVSFCREN